MRPARCFDPILICLINGLTDFDIALPARGFPLGLPYLQPLQKQCAARSMSCRVVDCCEGSGGRGLSITVKLRESNEMYGLLSGLL